MVRPTATAAVLVAMQICFMHFSPIGHGIAMAAPSAESETGVEGIFREIYANQMLIDELARSPLNPRFRDSVLEHVRKEDHTAVKLMLNRWKLPSEMTLRTFRDQLRVSWNDETILTLARVPGDENAVRLNGEVVQFPKKGSIRPTLDAWFKTSLQDRKSAANFLQDLFLPKAEAAAKATKAADLATIYFYNGKANEHPIPTRNLVEAVRARFKEKFSLIQGTDQNKKDVSKSPVMTCHLSTASEGVTDRLTGEAWLGPKRVHTTFKVLSDKSIKFSLGEGGTFLAKPAGGQVGATAIKELSTTRSTLHGKFAELIKSGKTADADLIRLTNEFRTSYCSRLESWIPADELATNCQVSGKNSDGTKKYAELPHTRAAAQFINEAKRSLKEYAKLQFVGGAAEYYKCPDDTCDFSDKAKEPKRVPFDQVLETSNRDVEGEALTAKNAAEDWRAARIPDIKVITCESGKCKPTSNWILLSTSERAEAEKVVKAANQLNDTTETAKRTKPEKLIGEDLMSLVMLGDGCEDPDIGKFLLEQFQLDIVPQKAQPAVK